MNPLDQHENLSDYLKTSSSITAQTADACGDEISQAANVLAKAFNGGHKLLLCGNGGSAADSQHIATEFISSLTKDVVRNSLPAIALVTDTSSLTAYSNDYEFVNAFARQVEGLSNPGDVLFALSTSGNSENIINAIDKANEVGVTTIAFTGQGGGAASKAASLSVKIPSDVTSHVQEAQLAVAHAICFMVEEALFTPSRQGWR